MEYLFEQFSKLAIHYKDMDIHSLYNAFIQKISEDEASFVSDHFMLFIKTGEAARETNQLIQNKILSSK